MNNHQPTLNEILSLIPKNFPELTSQKELSVAYKLNDEYRFAQSDNDITTIFKSSGKDINLYISVQNETDSLLSSIELRIAQLASLEKELILLHQNYGSNLQAKQIEQEKLQHYYDEQIQALKTKSNALESEIQRLKDATIGINTESAKYKESLKLFVNQFQSKQQEALELKKDRDEKYILEKKVLQLQKELNDKQTDNQSLMKQIQNATEERDMFSKKAEELETKQQTLESNYLQESLKISALPPEFSNSTQFSPANNTSALPFCVPSDLSEMDVQILYMAGIKLDTPSDQQRVFDLLREKQDISQILLSLM